MELHVIEREGRKTVVLLDNEMRIVKPVYDYLKFQRQKDKALNTLKASGSDLRTYWEFLNDNGYEYDKVTPKMIAEFIDYLRASDDDVIALNKESKRTNKTINRILSTIHMFYAVEEIIRIGQIKGWNVPQFHLPKTETANQLWNTKKSMRTNKTKPIPEDVFDKILYHAVHDEKDALTKAGIIIQSQTGLRINEVLSIQEGCVKRTSDGYDYMEVTLGKTEKGEPIIHKVFINGLVKNAIAELTEHTAELRKESGLKELFLCRIKSQNNKIAPYTETHWNDKNYDTSLKDMIFETIKVIYIPLHHISLDQHL